MHKTNVSIAVLVVASVIFVGGSAHAQQTELILSGFGGAYNDALTEIVADFEAENNVDVVVIPGSGADNIARVRNKEIDVIVSDPIFALRMEAEGAFAKLDPALIPNLADLNPKAVFSDAVIAENFGAYVIAYDPAKVTEVPDSWADLADPAYQGQIAMRGFRPENIELITLFAKLAGGDERHPDAGFAEMAKIGKNVAVWLDSHPDHLELYRNGQIAMSVWTDGRVAWANSEGVKVEAVLPKEGFFPLVSTLSIVDGRPNAELAQKLVNHLITEAAGIHMADKLGYFPTNTKTVLPAEIQERMLLTPENVESLQIADWAYLVTVYDEWQSRWEREIQR